MVPKNHALRRQLIYMLVGFALASIAVRHHPSFASRGGRSDLVLVIRFIASVHSELVRDVRMYEVINHS